MPQPIPKITNEDVERIIKREFPNSNFEAIKEILHQNESARVKVAAIKNSHGDIEKLKKQIASAKYDFREVIMHAEYPSYGENNEKDWAEYQAWLNK